TIAFFIALFRRGDFNLGGFLRFGLGFGADDLFRAFLAFRLGGLGFFLGGRHFGFFGGFVRFLFSAVIGPRFISMAFTLLGGNTRLWRSVRQIEEELRKQQRKERKN
ncbi:hypothetical protein K5M49_14970, partial [Serratia marcescens]|nr:hypothetical protein [Serratia marcescens]